MCAHASLTIFPSRLSTAATSLATSGIRIRMYCTSLSLRRPTTSSTPPEPGMCVCAWCVWCVSACVYCHSARVFERLSVGCGMKKKVRVHVPPPLACSTMVFESEYPSKILQHHQRLACAPPEQVQQRDVMTHHTQHTTHIVPVLLPSRSRCWVEHLILCSKNLLFVGKLSHW